MVTEWPLWWCCLNPSWRDMFNFLGDLAPTPDPAVLRSIYDANFELFIAPKNSWLYDWFNDSFEVGFTTVTLPIIGDVEIAIWALATWGQFNLWRGEPGYSCTVPCKYNSAPFALPP